MLKTLICKQISTFTHVHIAITLRTVVLR